MADASELSFFLPVTDVHEATGEAEGIIWILEIVFDNAPELESISLVGDNRVGRELGLGLGLSSFDELDKGHDCLVFMNSRCYKLGSKNIDNS